jgi:beta-lactamase regulating signal transducer with metallopeptidase domain
VLLGLGIPEWLTIIGLLGGLILTFYIMAKASVAYERKRKAREARQHHQEPSMTSDRLDDRAKQGENRT